MALILNGTTGASMVQDDAVNPVTDIASGIPCFSAYIGVATSVTSSYVKLGFNTKVFDTTNNFDTTLNRFIPNVAGYYKVNATCGFSSAASNQVFLILYKNGLAVQRGNRIDSSTNVSVSLDAIIYLNGTTDYIEIYGYSLVTTNTAITPIDTSFQSHLIVGA